ncbi:MAG: hypothetical protein QNI99_19350 [Woeseiaceae bacterium]|nr:hypothetical protein [Woeseiaceae bacterium]
MKLRYLVFLIAVPAAAAASEPPPLDHNPFSRPPSQVRVGEDRAMTELRPPTELVVTATMVSSGERLAHIDGRVLREGEEIYGYRLLRIDEDKAIFERNGETETVLVKPERDENDEPERRR